MKRSHRPLLYLAIALFVGAVVLLIEQPRAPRVDDASGSSVVPGLSSDKVWRIEVEQMMDGAELRRDDEGRWSVFRALTPLRANVLKQEGREAAPGRLYRGDAARIRGAIGTLVSLPKGVVVSRNAENQREYRVDDPTGLHVRLFGKGDAALADLVIGNSGPDLNGTYLRLAGSDEVLLVSRPLLGVFSPAAKDWRQRRFWSFPPDDVASVSIDDRGRKTVLTRDEAAADGWRSSTGLDGKGAAVVPDPKALASAAISISADAFPDEDAAAPATGNAEMIIAVERKDGRRLTLEIFAPDAQGRYPARIEGDEEVVLLAKKTLEALRGGPQGRG